MLDRDRIPHISMLAYRKRDEHMNVRELWERHYHGTDELRHLVRTWEMAHLPANYVPLRPATADPAYRRIDATHQDIVLLELKIRNAITAQLKRAQLLWQARHDSSAPASWQEEIDRWEGAGGQDLHQLIHDEAWRW
jgi:hypothetical protein